MVITGFEPVDILAGALRLVEMLERGELGVLNAYARVVHADGNPRSRDLVEEVFQVCDRDWRGIGEVQAGGYELRSKYREFDAALRFDVASVQARESSECLSGRILRGLAKPPECPAFGIRCTPEHPLGATMVSSEGACAAYFLAGRRREEAPA
jgi:hydrogenase expression/formation protein HypD